MRILKLTLLVVLCACTHSLYAQRHYAGVSALEFNYGMNMFGDCDNNLSLSVSKYKNRTTYWNVFLNSLPIRHFINTTFFSCFFNPIPQYPDYWNFIIYSKHI